METPVALFIFNRPRQTQQVFAEIRKQTPRRLLVVADGPRSSDEVDRCLATRSVIEQIDWECDLLTNYSESNLGCKRRIASGLDWVFQQCEDAIVLEDDCVPDASFFRYCSELLDFYRHDTRVMMISGDNYNPGIKRVSNSYYFSRYMHICGWASWRRAWQHYDVEMEHWPQLRDTDWLQTLLHDKQCADYFRGIFDAVHNGEVDTWDAQWLFTCWSQNGLSIQPNTNLITNIGYGIDAAHTKDPDHHLANLPTENIMFPLEHPRLMIRDELADRTWFERIVPPSSTLLRAYSWLYWKAYHPMPAPIREHISDMHMKVQSSLTRTKRSPQPTNR